MMHFPGMLQTVSLFSILSYAPMQAASSLYVSPAGGGDCSMAAPCSLQTAMTSAGDKDVLFLAEGHYTSAAWPVIHIDKNVTLVGGWNGQVAPAPNVSLTTRSVIDGENSRECVFLGPDVDVTMYNVAISNCSSVHYAAAIHALFAASLTLNYVEISNNESDDYGAMVYGGDNLDIKNSEFSNNTALGNFLVPMGGALRINGTVDVNIEHTSFLSNHAPLGSAIYAAPGNALIMRDLDVKENSGTEEAIWITGGATVSIEASRFKHNAGIYIFATDNFNFEGNTITGNTSSTSLTVRETGNLVLSNNLFHDNSNTSATVRFDTFGSAAANYVFIHNTLANNHTKSSVALYDVNLTAANNILDDDADRHIYCTGCNDVTFLNTLWWQTLKILEPTATETISSGNNFSADPLFVNPAAGDYHLRAASPAIGNARCDYAPSFDIDGDARLADGSCDLGADEFTPKLSPSTLIYLLN